MRTENQRVPEAVFRAFFHSQSQAGWSVVAAGRAHRVHDPDQVSRYERLLHPWVNHADTVLTIELHMVTGLRVIASKR